MKVEHDEDSTCVVNGEEAEKIGDEPYKTMPESSVDTAMFKAKEQQPHSKNPRTVFLEEADTVLPCGLDCMSFVGETLCWLVGSSSSMEYRCESKEKKLEDSDNETRDPVDEEDDDDDEEDDGDDDNDVADKKEDKSSSPRLPGTTKSQEPVVLLEKPMLSFSDASMGTGIVTKRYRIVDPYEDDNEANLSNERLATAPFCLAPRGKER